LRNSALVQFEVTADSLFSKSGFRHWFSKYRPLLN